MAVVVYRISARERSFKYGPWCAKCDYSLYGDPSVASCPECGTNLSLIPPVVKRKRARRLMLALSYAAILCIVVPLVRFAPCRHSLFVDFRIKTATSPNVLYDDEFWDNRIGLLYAWQPGYQWSVMWGWDELLAGPSNYGPITMNLPGFKIGDDVGQIVIDPDTLDFHYRNVKSGEVVTGESLDEHQLLAWFADGGFESESPDMHAEARFVTKVIRHKAAGEPYRATPADPMTVRYHVPVRSRHPHRSMLLIVIALLVMVASAMWVQRWIRKTVVYQIADPVAERT